MINTPASLRSDLWMLSRRNQWMLSIGITGGFRRNTHVQRSKLLADSCPPWQGIYLDMKRRAGLYTPATRNGFTNSLGNGLEIFAYTRTTSSVAPSEKTIG